ncbi:hypothetical protein Tco_1213278 [Tanacetum coccineum]
MCIKNCTTHRLCGRTNLTKKNSYGATKELVRGVIEHLEEASCIGMGIPVPFESTMSINILKALQDQLSMQWIYEGIYEYVMKSKRLRWIERKLCHSVRRCEDEAESKPKIEKKTVKPSFAKIEFVKSKEQGNPQQDLQEKGVIDSGCSRHMTGNMSYLTDFEEIDGGYVAFGGNPKGGENQCIDHLGKFGGKADEGFFVGYSINCKAFRVFNRRTMIVKENLHVQFSENTPNIAGSRPNWLFDIDALTKSLNYKPVVFNESPDAGFKPSGDNEKKVTEEPGKEGGDPSKEGECNDQDKEDNVNSANNINAASINENIIAYLIDDEDVGADGDINNLDITIQVSPIPTTSIHKDHPLVQVMEMCNQHNKNAFFYGIDGRRGVCIAKPPGFEDPNFPDRVYKVEKALYGLHQALRACLWGCMDYIKLLELGMKPCQHICWTMGFKEGKLTRPYSSKGTKTASTPMETQKPLLKHEDGKEVDVHMYRSMIGSLMYLTSSRPDIMFAVCACARYQVNPKVSHLHAVKSIFRYLKCKKQIVVANSTTEAEYVAALSCCGQVLWIQNQLLDYGFAYKSFLCSANPTDPHHTPTIIQSSTQPQNTQQPRKPKRKDTQVPQPSDHITNVDEVVHKELGNSLVRAATTTSSLEAEQDSGNINKTQSKATPNESSSQGTNSGGSPRCQETMGHTTARTRFESVYKHSNDSLLARGNTLRSDEDRLKLNELMTLCANLQNRVLDLEQSKTTQHNESVSLKSRVKKLEKKNRSRTHRLKRLYKVGLTVRVESSGDEESLGEDNTVSREISLPPKGYAPDLLNHGWQQDFEDYTVMNLVRTDGFLKTNDMVEKEVYNELSNRFLQLEKHCISLEISMQQKEERKVFANVRIEKTEVLLTQVQEFKEFKSDEHASNDVWTKQFKPRSSSNDVWTKQFKPRSSSNDVWTKQFKPRSSSNDVWTKQFKPRSSSKDVWTKQFRPRSSS